MLKICVKRHVLSVLYLIWQHDTPKSRASRAVFLKSRALDQKVGKSRKSRKSRDTGQPAFNCLYSTTTFSESCLQMFFQCIKRQNLKMSKDYNFLYLKLSFWCGHVFRQPSANVSCGDVDWFLTVSAGRTLNRELWYCVAGLASHWHLGTNIIKYFILFVIYIFCHLKHLSSRSWVQQKFVFLSTYLQKFVLMSHFLWS